MIFNHFCGCERLNQLCDFACSGTSAMRLPR
jgi:hypothetical protein